MRQQRHEPSFHTPICPHQKNVAQARATGLQFPLSCDHLLQPVAAIASLSTQSDTAIVAEYRRRSEHVAASQQRGDRRMILTRVYCCSVDRRTNRAT
jgi:hypothetical protein